MQSLSQFKFGNPKSVLEMLSQMIPNYGAINNPQYAGMQNQGSGAFHFGQPMPTNPSTPSQSPALMNPAPQESAPTSPQWYGMNGQTGLDPSALAALGAYQSTGNYGSDDTDDGS